MNLFETVKKNIEISKQYLELYPSLVRYMEIRKEIDEKGRTNVPKTLHEESSKLWDQFKHLELYDAVNFLIETTGENEKYLTDQLTADPMEVLSEIKVDIEEYLAENRFNPTYNFYNHEEHVSAIEMKKEWDKVESKEDFFKVLSDPYKYTTFGDFCPFYNTYKQRKAKLVNIVINNDIEIDDDTSPLDLEISTFKEILDMPSKEKAEKDQNQFEKDQETIENVIEQLLPICERAKELDSCWDNNFLNNKVVAEIKRRMQ